MSYFTYVTQTPHLNYLYMSNLERGVSHMELNDGQRFFVSDKDRKHTLAFCVSGVAIADKPLVAEMCRSIAYMANGSIRRLVEDSRVLLLMKEFGLTEIYHSTNGGETLTTLWTPEDAEALMS